MPLCVKVDAELHDDVVCVTVGAVVCLMAALYCVSACVWMR